MEVTLSDLKYIRDVRDEAIRQQLWEVASDLRSLEIEYCGLLGKDPCDPAEGWTAAVLYPIDNRSVQV